MQNVPDARFEATTVQFQIAIEPCRATQQRPEFGPDFRLKRMDPFSV